MAQPFLSIGSRDFRDFAARARSVDKKVLTSLRREVKTLGSGMLEGSRKTLLMPPPNDSPEWSVGAREAISAGMRTQLSFGKSNAGVKFVASPSRLDPEHKGFLAAYNQKSIRHPVFGNRSVFVQQQGRPYFGSVILQYLNKNDVKQMLRVIDDAFRAVGART